MPVSFNLAILGLNALIVSVAFLVPLSTWLVPRVRRSKSKKVNKGRVPAGTQELLTQTVMRGIGGATVLYLAIRFILLAPSFLSAWRDALASVQAVCVFAICTGFFPHLCGDWLKRFTTDSLSFNAADYFIKILKTKPKSDD